MARTNAQQWVEKWSRRLQGAGADIKAGVDRVTVAPGQAAAAAQNRMLAGVTEAVTSGKWAARVGSVTLQDWKNSMTTKGVNRIADGVNQAAKSAQVQANVSAFLSDVDAATAAISNMPQDTVEQRIARSAAFQREMSQRSQQRK